MMNSLRLGTKGHSMKCFYHSADLDGHCSGAIVKHKFPEAELIPIDYQDDFPFDTINSNDNIIMVDFSLPIDNMRKLADLCDRFVWIDHHKTAIEEYNKLCLSSIATIKPFCGIVHDINKASCELTWEYCHSNSTLPFFVYLLGRYDVWDHKNDKVLPFQFVMRSFDTDPREDNDKIWVCLFDNYCSPHKEAKTINKLCQTGQAIMRYVNHADKQIIKSGSFDIEIGGHKALAINVGRTNYRDYDHNKYDLMVAFQRFWGKWRVTMYSDHIDVGALAQEFGGGGHEGAAGFICDVLPFSI